MLRQLPVEAFVSSDEDAIEIGENVGEKARFGEVKTVAFNPEETEEANKLVSSHQMAGD